MNLRPPAAIADMDGSLCDVSSIRHHVVPPPGVEKDFAAFHAASINCPAHDMAIQWCIDHYEAGETILIVTGRMDRWLRVSTTWLDRELPVPYDGPFMRADGDRRSDYIVKKEIRRYLDRHYDIRAALDDNPSIIRLWNELGTPVTVVPGWDYGHERCPA